MKLCGQKTSKYNLQGDKTFMPFIEQGCSRIAIENIDDNNNVNDMTLCAKNRNIWT